MAEYELCPNDGTRLWYHSDQYGRITGRCDTCNGRYRRSVVVVTPVMPTMPYRHRDDHAPEKVLAAVIAHPGISKQSVAIRAGVNKERAVYALNVLIGRGAIVRRVKRHQQQGRSTVVYYPGDHTDIPPDDQSGPERVLSALRQQTEPICTAHLSRLVGMSQHRTNEICGDLHKLGTLARCRTYIRNSRGQRMPVAAWSIAP
jgi:hypothetical protein